MAKDTDEERPMHEHIKDIIYGSRVEEYGDPRISFAYVAQAASCILDKSITEHDVLIILMILKMVRENTGHKRDNLIDLIGYATILDEIHDRR